MSEPIPESIPTSSDPRSKRPTKRRALTPVSAQASSVSALFAHPEREVHIPEAATKDGIPKTLAPPPEIVANVQGSSAGAGSGEFHVYKASRRREYERIRLMEEETRKEKETEEFERKKEEREKKDEGKTSKNRAKREKQKARKAKKEGKGAGEEAKTKVGMKPRAKEKVDGESKDGEEAGAEGDQEDGAPAEEIGVIIHDED